MAEKETFTEEDVSIIPVTLLYNYIRFNNLKETSKGDLKKLFLKLFNVSLKSKEILPMFVKELNSGDYKSFTAFAQKYAIDPEQEIKKMIQ